MITEPLVEETAGVGGLTRPEETAGAGSVTVDVGGLTRPESLGFTPVTITADHTQDAHDSQVSIHVGLLFQ